MNIIIKCISLALCFLVLSCTEKTIIKAQAEPSPSKGVEDSAIKQAAIKQAVVIKRGDALPNKTEYVSLDLIADQPEKYAGQEVLVQGAVTAVCKAKGCWMTIAGEKPTSRARVTFKEYAFFVPMDIKGKKVKLKGEIKVKMLAEAERKHLAEDGQVPVSDIPKAELRLVASGVEIHP